MAKIQFSLSGKPEEVIPDIRMTRAKDGSNGTATSGQVLDLSGANCQADEAQEWWWGYLVGASFLLFVPALRAVANKNKEVAKLKT